jgi:hypothetical protein
MKRSSKLPDKESVQRGHEVSDVHFGKVVITGFGLLVLMLAGLFFSEIVAHMFMGSAGGPDSPGRVLIDPDSAGMPPEPRLERDSYELISRLRAAEDAGLMGYSWEDRQAGLVRVPVRRAMELALEHRILKGRD